MFLASTIGFILIFLVYLISLKYSRYVFIGVLIYLIHILMDIFTGPTPIFWPLINYSYSAYLDLNASLGVNGLSIYPLFKISSENTNFLVGEEVGGALISSMGIISLIGLISFLIAEYILKVQDNKHHP